MLLFQVMKTLIILLLSLVTKHTLAESTSAKNASLSKPKAADIIVIEEGEDYKVPAIKEKIWIENQRVLKAHTNGGRVVLKPQGIGSTVVRLDSKTKNISVVPVGYKSSWEMWHKLNYQFANVHLGFWSGTPCLQGKLSSFIEFQKMMRIMQEKDAFMNICLDSTKELAGEIEGWYRQYFRENNMTPVKIQFGKIWKVFLSQKESFKEYKDQLVRVGLFVAQNKQNLEIADNVRVEIKITEISNELTRTLGMSWPEEYNAQVINTTNPGIESFDLVLKAHEKNGEMKVLASPNLISRSGKSAEFFAGGEFPIVTQVSERRQMVVWKKYGISLNIKPVIDSTGQMSIELETEISTLDKARGVGGIPAISSRKVSSHFDLIESKTIALSGLIKNETGSTKDGLPFLGQIPILGKLFASEEFLDNKTELVIFVTPKLMEP